MFNIWYYFSSQDERKCNKFWLIKNKRIVYVNECQVILFEYVVVRRIDIDRKNFDILFIWFRYSQHQCTYLHLQRRIGFTGKQIMPIFVNISEFLNYFKITQEHKRLWWRCIDRCRWNHRKHVGCFQILTQARGTLPEWLHCHSQFGRRLRILVHLIYDENINLKKELINQLLWIKTFKIKALFFCFFLMTIKLISITYSLHIKSY